MIRILKVLAIVFGTFDVLIWHNVLTGDVPVRAAHENVGAPVRTENHDVAAHVADESAVVEAEGPIDERPGRPLDAGGQPKDQRKKQATEPASAMPAAHENTGAPVRITIPSIAVDAAVERVALAADGSMDVPKRLRNAAWYALGPRPGETGSAAIAGHVDGPRGTAAVFADLHKVRAGDKIAVRDDRGDVTHFVVRGSRRYDAEADAADVFTSNDGKAHLNIITCDGTWDKLAEQYSERLVVFADKETEQ